MEITHLQSLTPQITDYTSYRIGGTYKYLDHFVILYGINVVEDTAVVFDSVDGQLVHGIRPQKLQWIPITEEILKTYGFKEFCTEEETSPIQGWGWKTTASKAGYDPIEIIIMDSYMWKVFIKAHTDKETRNDINADFEITYLDELETILQTLGINWK